MTRSSTLRDILRETHRQLTSLLLVGAMLAPLVSAIAGWPVHTAFDVPLSVHLGMLVAVGLVAFGLSERDDGTPARRRPIGWLLVPALAVSFAVIVHERANVFYTGSAIVDGSAVLFTLHVAVGMLRARAHRRLDVHLVPHEPRGRWRRGAEWGRRLRARALPTTPALWLSDGLTISVGWLVLASWVLIALEHRHPAGPVLLAAGALEALAFLALVPDALAGSPQLLRRHS